MKNKAQIIMIGVLCIAIAICCGIFTYKYLDKKNDKKKNPSTEPTPVVENTDFNINLIKTVNGVVDNENYLISPYSIEIALNMLKEGAHGEGREEIEKVVGTREIPVFDVKDRISVANGIFVKDVYKDAIKNEFYSKMNDYSADVVYDPFTSPDKINKWVEEKTYGMIPDLLDSISPDFVLGIANAVAIDVEWARTFECNHTYSQEFTKADGSKMNVEMMHKDIDSEKAGKYFETDDSKGVILPYVTYKENGEKAENGTKLEFVAILPNEDVNTYVNNLTTDKLNEIDSKVIDKPKNTVKLSLPRFKYDFDLKRFMDVLIDMGIKNVFDPANADLTNIMSKEDQNGENLYVAKAIHRTHIDLNEKGTKAAAVTYFSVEKNAAIGEEEYIDVVFNKPFVYMIRDSKTKEVLFFGVVHTPNEWKGSTCSEEE